MYVLPDKYRKGFIKMDNNRYSSNRPRRKVSRRTYRNRRLAALAIIAFLVLILIVLIANACADDNEKKPSDSKSGTTITTTTTVTDEAIPTTVTTTVASTVPKNDSDFELDRQTISIMVGESDMPRVLEYPDGTVEDDERWTSSDKEIATVDDYGHITGVAPGVCYVILKSAADLSQEVWIKVTVRSELSDDETTTTNMPQSNRTEAPAPPVHDTEGLTYIDGILLVNKEYGVPATFEPKLEQICYDQFNELSTAAAKEGLSIYISSGYRSYKDQETIYNNYIEDEKKKGNSEAEAKKIVDTYSARPGYSEHQSGLCIDVNTINDAFGYTSEAAWLAEHAHEYGFIIRYPQGKEDITGYQYEPWHIRYVGSKVANKIYKSGQCLEEYLNVG